MRTALLSDGGQVEFRLGAAEVRKQHAGVAHHRRQSLEHEAVQTVEVLARDKALSAKPLSLKDDVVENALSRRISA